MDSEQCPADTPAVRLVHMACARYFIERGFQGTKISPGLADCQTRGWLAWRDSGHPVMLAMLFQAEGAHDAHGGAPSAQL
ncbi:MAG: hypothetical protein JWM59_1709 [Verrucomicrobiales bacterium]|nr:hypothetical protein [Verrucomicrobiales bacterium]